MILRSLHIDKFTHKIFPYNSTFVIKMVQILLKCQSFETLEGMKIDSTSSCCGRYCSVKVFLPAIKLRGLIVLRFNDTSTLVGHFVSSLREREIKEIVEQMKERDGEERGTGMNGTKQKK